MISFDVHHVKSVKIKKTEKHLLDGDGESYTTRKIIIQTHSDFSKDRVEITLFGDTLGDLKNKK